MTGGATDGVYIVIFLRALNIFFFFSLSACFHACSRVAKRGSDREGILMARASDYRCLSCPGEEVEPGGLFQVFFQAKETQLKTFSNTLHKKHFSTFVRVFNFRSP